MQYLSQRFGFFLLTLALSILFSFLLMHLAPGDPVELMLGADAPETQKIVFRQQLGLDQPLGTQLKSYVLGIFKGNLGQSLSFQKPVSHLLLTYFPYTLLLACVAMIFTTVLGLSFGIVTALLHRFQFLSFFLLAISIVGQSTPNFFLGPVLILLLAIQLPWFPVSGFTTASHLVLPALTLALSLFALVSRMTAVGLIAESRKDYYTTALAKGLSTLRATITHALRNVSIPVTQILGLQLGALLSGTVVTEYIFDWPGIGLLFFSAISTRDFPLIQSLILVFTLSFACINFLVDLVGIVLDPRLRTPAYEKV